MNSEETQNQAGQTAYLERAKALGINPANQVQVSATSGKIGTPKTASVMDASTLGAPALKVPETTPVSTVASGIGGMASSIAETSAKAITDSLNADKAAKEAELKDSKGLIKSLQEQVLNVAGSRQAEEEKAQIAQKAQATSDARAEAQIASNNIIASQRAQQNEIAQLEKNLGGMSASALQGETQRINRQYAKEQADLSLISLVANTKLNNANFDLATAQSIVDKKIENQLEPLKMQMDFAREFYQENRDAFSKAEDREFQNNALMAERAYNTEKANLERISALQLKAMELGAPASVISKLGKTQNYQEALSIIGPYAQKAVKRDTQIVDINGQKVLVDTQTGQTIATIKGDGSTQDVLAGAIAQNNINSINNVISSKALDSVVGPNGLSQTSPGLWGATKRFFAGALAGGATGAVTGSVLGGVGAIPGAIIGALTVGTVNALNGTKDELFGDRQNFIASTEQLRSQLTLDSLIRAKSNGATFGALSDGERQLLANAGTKLSTWAVTDNGKIDGKVIGYNVSEKEFKKEMDTINYYAKLDYIKKGGNPEDIGAITQPDGTVWSLNSDGTLSQLK